MSSRILLTGFGPFGTIKQNPSQQLVEASGHPHRIIPVTFEAADLTLKTIEGDNWEILLMLGVAEGRNHLCPELVARNLIGDVPDVNGVVGTGRIDPDAPTQLPTTLWTTEDVDTWSQVHPIQASDDAGSYLCNYIYFRALQRFPLRRVGFLHIPTFKSVPKDAQSKIVGEIIETILSRSSRA